MKLHLNKSRDVLLIHSCIRTDDSPHTPDENGKSNKHYKIRIGDKWYRQSVILTPHSVKLWDVAEVSQLSEADFSHFAELDAEVIILGGGARAVFPDPAMTRPLMQKQIGLEVMDTGAACRTYNSLVGDGRLAAAALIL